MQEAIAGLIAVALTAIIVICLVFMIEGVNFDYAQRDYCVVHSTTIKDFNHCRKTTPKQFFKEYINKEAK